MAIMAVHSFNTFFCFVLLGSFISQFSQAFVVPPGAQTPLLRDLPSYNYGIYRELLRKRQTGGAFPVKGAFGGSGPNGSVLIRPELQELERDPYTFTLYILGLDFMQFTSQDDPLSWYQIAGIHGRPFLPWNGVQATPGNQNNGYCTHVSILFPTWHRPYLALFEQALYDIIQFIASLYPSGPARDRYVAAAANFRIPYWDWAAEPPPGKSVFPESVGGSPGINVDGPFGTQLIANPLYSYMFHPLNTTELPDYPLNQFYQTMRYPTTYNSSATSQNNLVAQQLDNNRAAFSNRLYNLFTIYHDYVTFSNEAWIPQENPNGYDSIESIHDTIHGLIGSGGHMMYIDYAAFDPVFFLHHAMIDRCFAMWQKLNPNSYVVPEPSTYGTFTTSPGQLENGETFLTPFFNGDVKGFWNPLDVQHTETFGYTYLETSQIPGESVSDVSARVLTAVNQLYGNFGPSKGSGKSRRSLYRDDSMGLRNRDSLISVQYREWIANIRVEKHALPGSFFIHLFLGSFGDDPVQWSFEPNLVGTHTIFLRANHTGEHCAPCQTSALHVTATMPLTTFLLQKIDEGKLRSLETQEVESYLRENMKYRITMMDDSPIANEEVSSLKITVVSATVVPPISENEFPAWGTLEEHFDIDGSI